MHMARVVAAEFLNDGTAAKVKLLHEGIGHTVTCELKTGRGLRGLLELGYLQKSPFPLICNAWTGEMYRGHLMNCEVHTCILMGS